MQFSSTPCSLAGTGCRVGPTAVCTARPIRDNERATLASLLRDTRQRLAEGWLNPREIATGEATKLPALPQGATPQDAAAWTIVARVLLNLDETLTKS